MANGLSCPFAITTATWTHNGLDPHKLAEDQASDPNLTVATDSSLQLEQVQFDQHLHLWCDISCRVPWPYLPLAWHQPTFDKHLLSHPSIWVTHHIVSSKFIWPGLTKDIMQWVYTFICCQVAKVQRHTRVPWQQFELPDQHFQHIHVDIVGPLPKSEGQAYLFTIVNHFTHWPKAVPMSDSTAVSCTQALLHNWIMRFGIPDMVMLDRGAQFTGQLWHQLAQHFGFQCNHTTAYHLQANGLVEWLHHHLKASLTAWLTTSTWTQKLP